MRHPLHQTPHGGLGHRVFAGMGPVDQVTAAFAFEPPLTDAQLQQAQAALDHFSQTALREDADEPCHCDEPFLSPRTLRIRVHNLVEPVLALQQLQDALAGALPLRELHLARWAPVRGGAEGELGLVVDPAMPEEQSRFPRHDDYLRAVFDLAEPPPASEYASQGNGAYATPSGDIVVEERGMPLHLPPLRLCYGTAQSRFAPSDARCVELAQSLGTVLQSTFAPLAAGKAPRFFEHGGGFGKVDRLQVAHRQGFGFAVASPELVQRLSATRYRYREHELFEALLALTLSQELAPIVTWQRFGQPFAKDFRNVQMHVIQLWEPGRPLGP
jgi:hypothetical protein